MASHSPETDFELHVDPALRVALDASARWLDSLPSRPVRADVDTVAVVDALRAAGGADGGIPELGSPAADVVARLVDAVEPGLVATPGPRFYGWVIGGSLPSALAADWLTSAWDQNAGLVASSPAAAATEHVAAQWLLDVLALPRYATVGFVTGGNQANFSCLAAARHAALRDHGWDVEARGLQGAPTVHVVASVERHATVDVALRYLGLGTATVHPVETDEQSRMRPDDLERVLAGLDGPIIVCSAAGNVNSGAFDDFAAVISIAHAKRAWVHVDGAFGLWAAASPHTRHLVDGVELADSWAADGHKTLNVPYDSGFAIITDPAAHTGALAATASYLSAAATAIRNPLDLVPEFSRRARGFATWAALAELGREGLRSLVEQLCERALQFADELAGIPGVEIENDVVFNQVMFRVDDDDERTRTVGEAVCAEGVAFMTPTTWKGRASMRVSVSNWSTSSVDVTASVDAVRRAVERVRVSSG